MLSKRNRDIKWSRTVKAAAPSYVAPKRKNRVIQPNTQAPVSAGSIRKLPRPVVTNTPGGVYVKNRELFHDIEATTTALEVKSIFINPGMGNFRWLRDIAGRFEKYRFKKLSFLYAPACSTAENGKVILAVDYDPKDAAPTDLGMIMSYEGATRTNMWLAAEMKCRSSSEFRVNRSGTNSTVNTRVTDHGVLHIATAGNSGIEPGEVYVDYEVEFIIPQMRIDGTSEIGVTNPTPAAPYSVNSDGVVVKDSQFVPFVRLNDTTLKFIQDWQGLLVTKAATDGTNCVYSGDPTLPQIIRTYNGGNMTALHGIKAKLGDEMQLVFTAATVLTALQFWFARGDYTKVIT